jgi:hypothetical protein
VVWVLRLDRPANLVRLSHMQTSPKKDNILAGLRWDSHGPLNGIRCRASDLPRLAIGMVYASLPRGGSHHDHTLRNSRQIGT